MAGLVFRNLDGLRKAVKRTYRFRIRRAGAAEIAGAAQNLRGVRAMAQNRSRVGEVGISQFPAPRDVRFGACKAGGEHRRMDRELTALSAKLIQFAAENYRRQKYSPVTGIFQ